MMISPELEGSKVFFYYIFIYFRGKREKKNICDVERTLKDKLGQHSLLFLVFSFTMVARCSRPSTMKLIWVCI